MICAAQLRRTTNVVEKNVDQNTLLPMLSERTVECETTGRHTPVATNVLAESADFSAPQIILQNSRLISILTGNGL
jgi:hypothetical protein